VLKLSLNLLSYHGKLVRWGILGFSFTPLLGTYLYTKGYKLQFIVCPIRHFTGIPCPGCGMTRSFLAIARGDWHQAVAEHLFGPLLFASFVIAVVHIMLELLTKRQITAFYWQLLKLRKLQIIGLSAIFTYYFLRLYYISQTGELYFSFIHSPLGKLLSVFNIS
jgi:hypothetical protein